jgi:hypothetical protein
MNPLRWKREHQLAWVVICMIGAIIGLLFAWFQDPFYQLCHTSLSGQWANCTRVFFEWLPNVGLYWPLPMFGALITGLTFYAVRLLTVGDGRATARNTSGQPQTGHGVHVISGSPDGHGMKIDQEASGRGRVVGSMWFPLQNLFLILSNLWEGKYSLARSFWGFFLCGTFVAIIAGMLAGIPFILIDAQQAAGRVFQIVFWGYEIIAAVGVWRSANALIKIRAGRASLTYADSAKVFAAKLGVVVVMLGNLQRSLLGSKSVGEFFGFLLDH